MTDRIDHAAEAVALLNLAVAAQHQGDPRHLIAAAQTHATLALVEQHRVANQIALSSLTYEIEDIHDAIGQRALRQLPDIAAALGIKAVDHE